MTKKQKEEIDSMTQLQLCSKWRFSKPGDPIFIGETGDYFRKVMDKKGGMTPQISKQLGWGIII